MFIMSDGGFCCHECALLELAGSCLFDMCCLVSQQIFNVTCFNVISMNVSIVFHSKLGVISHNHLPIALAGLQETTEAHKSMEAYQNITKGNRAMIIKIFLLLAFFVFLFMLWT